MYIAAITKTLYIMKKLITTLLLIISIGSYAQQYEQYLSVSIYSSMNFSKGFELRGEFEDWYISFQAENFIKETETFFNWGGTIGLMKKTYNFNYYGGIRVGFLNLQGDSKPLYGLESEISYNINESVFIGIRGTYDRYFDSPNIQTPTAKSMLRGFIKLGYRF